MSHCAILHRQYSCWMVLQGENSAWVGLAGRQWRKLESSHDFGAMSRPRPISEHAPQHMDPVWQHLAQSCLDQSVAGQDWPEVVHSCGATIANLLHQLMHNLLRHFGGNLRPVGARWRDGQHIHRGAGSQPVCHVCHLARKVRQVC